MNKTMNDTTNSSVEYITDVEYFDHEEAGQSRDAASLKTKAVACMLAGALAVSMLPLSAFADEQNGGADSSSSDSSNQQGAQPPEGSSQGTPPSGEPPQNSDGSTTPPEKPEGDSGEAPSGEPPSGQPGDGQGGAPGGAPGDVPGGADTQSFDYNGSYSAASVADGAQVDSNGETIESSTTDENAALAQNGGTLNLDAATVNKSGDSTNDDNCNFYGTNSGVLAVGEGSQAYVTDSTINTSSTGSNGIFSTDTAYVYVNNTSITTTSESGNSRGLDATYGGTIVANKMTIDTAGGHSAAVATDRGGGSISLTNSVLSTAGSGSPLLYSTGDIEVENVEGTASGSQIAGMEGLNSILISNSTLSSTNNAISGSDPIKNGVIIYQSTSGDAETSTGDAANFTAVDSKLSTTIDSGSMFYLTNTTANVVLSNTELDFDSDKVALLTAQGNDSNGWGTAGSNGATVNFTLSNQEASGDIVVDDISTANVYLTDNSTWTGATSTTENSASDKTMVDAPLSVSVDAGSTWVVTADSTVSTLNIADGGNVVDASGKTVTIVANGETVVQGDSDLTVTVTGTYATTVELSEANQAASADIDRSVFDAAYSTSTTFGNNDTNVTRGVDSSDSTAQVQEAVSSPSSQSNSLLDFFASLWRSMTGGN